MPGSLKPSKSVTSGLKSSSKSLRSANRSSTHTSAADKVTAPVNPVHEPYVPSDPFEREFLASYPQKAAPTAGPGHPGHLTESQEQALHALREILLSEGFTKRLDDASLLRFLRARQFDVSHARDMFAECERWRKEEKVDTILEEFVYEEKSQVMQYYPQYYHKTDKDGRPVYYEDLSKISISKMLAITSMERMLRNLVWEYEAFTRYRLPACSRQHGHLVETSCTVLDLKNASIGTARKVYGYISQASHVGQNYYPERMGKFYVINAPWGFSAVWSVIKRFLDPVTVDKIHILSSSYQDELRKQIPVENLPTEYGGLSKTEGPIYMADEGPWRDEQYVGPEGLAPIAGKTKATPPEKSLNDLSLNEDKFHTPPSV